MQQSKLHIHSYGVVAVNKVRSSHEIEVTPLETIPLANGELTDASQETKAKGVDHDGSAFETSVNTSATLTCRWLPMGSNRATPPDVRRGEKVAIYRFGDADKYYWTSLEYDSKLRKLETVIWQFSNTQDEGAEATSETTYYLEVSTHDKVIHLHTGTSDGEPYGYDITLDTKNGRFNLLDTLKNYFLLDTGEKRWLMLNGDASYLEVVKKDVNIYAVENFNVRAGKNINMFAGENKTVQVGAEEFTKVVGSRTANVGKDILYTAPGTMKVTTPLLDTSKDFKTGGIASIGSSLSTGNTAGAGGESTINGQLTIVNGGLDVEGSIKSGGDGTFTGRVSASNVS